MIADPAASLENPTREERRAARLAVWVPWWRDANATQKKNKVWDAFLDFYAGMTIERQARLQARVRTAMNDPDATLAEMKDHVYNDLSTRQLLRVMAWLS